MSLNPVAALGTALIGDVAFDMPADTPVFLHFVDESGNFNRAPWRVRHRPVRCRSRARKTYWKRWARTVWVS